MAWIESHQELARHPKTKRLARLLDTSSPAVIGHLHLLWYWAIDYAEDGDLSRFDIVLVSDAVEWEGDPSTFVDAMVEAGFLDREGDRLAIHDWPDYTGKLVARRAANRQRMRSTRAPDDATRGTHVQRTKQPRETHVQDTCDVCAEPQNSTKPNSTEQNKGESLTRAPGGGASRTPRATKPKKSWEPPEWFRPLTELPGYKQRDHSARAATLAAACSEAGADVTEVVADFAAYYRTARITNGWSDPVAVLNGRPLTIQISQVLRKGGHRDAIDGSSASYRARAQAQHDENVRLARANGQTDIAE